MKLGIGGELLYRQDDKLYKGRIKLIQGDKIEIDDNTIELVIVAVSKNTIVKGAVLNAIHDGHDHAKAIFESICYPHHIDSLYRELNFLRAYGYISVEKRNGISYYSLTKKGKQHALKKGALE